MYVRKGRLRQSSKRSVGLKRYRKRTVGALKRRRYGRSKKASKQLIKQLQWDLGINVGNSVVAPTLTPETGSLCLGLSGQADGVGVGYNFFLGNWPTANDVNNTNTSLRGNKGYFKTQLHRVTMWQSQSALGPPYPTSGTSNPYISTPIQGWRIIFVRPRANNSFLTPGQFITDPQLNNGGVPRDFRDQFSAQFLQIFKVLKDKNYYISTGATLRTFSWFGTSVTSATQYQPMYTMNGTKPCVLTRTFKFKIKQPLTYNTDTIPADQYPIDLQTKKVRYMLIYPIPAEPLPVASNGEEIRYDPAAGSSELRINPWYFQTSAQTTFYDS